MTGSATWRDSAFASSRAEAARARGGERRPVARDAGHERARLREAERERVGQRPRPSAPRRCGERASAIHIATAPAASPAAIVGGVPSRRSIGRSSV